MLNGAVMVMADLSRALTIHLPNGLDGGVLYGSGTKSSGVGTDPQGSDHRRNRDGRLLLVGDIVDTGLTLSYLVSSLRARGDPPA